MISWRQLTAAAVAIAALAGPAASSVYAQTPPAPPALQAGFQDGFFIQTADGNNRLVLGMVAQTDGRFDLDSTKPIVNTFTIRKFRPTLTGRLWKYFDFKFMPDFGNGTAVISDAYFDIRFSPKFRIRSGKDKVPIGYELIQGDGNLWFPERSLASSLVPNRDIGVQVQGDLSPKLFYAAGVFNGIPDASSSTTELDTNSSKDLDGRVVVQPFRSATPSSSALTGLGFQVGGSNGTQIGALPSFKTSVGQTYFSYGTGVTAAGVRNRVAPAVFYYYKRLGFFSEYMRSAQTVAKAGVDTKVVNQAWDATGSFFLTGEAASYGLIRPKTNFNPAGHHWGALQLVARVTKLTVDADAFASLLAATGASRKARTFTLGANWYPNQSVKIYGTFERTVFDDHAAGARAPEDVILFRTQVGF